MALKKHSKQGLTGLPLGQVEACEWGRVKAVVI